ncbi:hypothetical protein [Modestobacter sp. NPDC049651]|uniref:hypothetical protein n=1 Tax=unclassified Modestobacter TaxID=2643866 RepID=UPI0033DF7996
MRVVLPLALAVLLVAVLGLVAGALARRADRHDEAWAAGPARLRWALRRRGRSRRSRPGPAGRSCPPVGSTPSALPGRRRPVREAEDDHAG